ncbi:MAG: hypothetical protein A3F16_08230 [Deltaproteobacteria bacterium RIFCSPHIGHO2_12_FULL_43_9]|nr:MAG: hypothetical protein A3F16_08230 [Deltaproteobacteria bacterium RIFCSPHIGHO2_12_FULL_43_9]
MVLRFYRIAEKFLLLYGIKREVIDLPDVRLHTLHYSNDKADSQVVLLHGIGASAVQFSKIIPKLRKKYEIWVPHLPPFLNFSQLKIPKTYLTAVGEANILSPWLHELSRRKKLILVGTSFGGWVAMEYSVRFPSAVSKLVLINSSGITLGLREARDYFARIKGKKELLEILSLIYTRWKRYLWLWAPLFRAAWEHPSVQHLLFDEDGQVPIDDELRKLTMPVTIIWGEEDQLIRKDVALEFNRLIPHSTLHFIPNCGHSPVVERPRETAKLILDL